tara:strand:- start:3888 stop:4598 length:711 start_codon:yes stop_codon:yes gene_type:complete
LNLPLIDPFEQPFEAWQTRSPTAEEILANKSIDPINVELIATINDPVSAARYVANGAPDSGLDNHISNMLRASAGLKQWRRAMPSRTPKPLSVFQRKYVEHDIQAVTKEIQQHGRLLSPGQRLFHGGLWWGDGPTSKPLSTSFSPQVAFKNAEWKGKAYDAGRIDLMVLKVASPNVKAFAFKHKGTSNGHEKEVLLLPGLTLTCRSSILVRQDCLATKPGDAGKQVDVYVLEIDMS